MLAHHLKKKRLFDIFESKHWKSKKISTSVIQRRSYHIFEGERTISPDVVAVGHLLVEIMRKEKDIPHDMPGVYMGPYPSGAPAIFIDAVGRLGASCGFVGCVGDDDFGRMLTRRLEADGVDTSHVRVVKDYTTGTNFVMYFSDGRRKFLYHVKHSAAGQLRPEDVDPQYVGMARCLHIMGQTLTITDSIQKACYKAVKCAAENDMIISLDPNLRPELLGIDEVRRLTEPILRVATVVLPSGEEASMLTGIEDEVEACRRILTMGPKVVALKQGKRGCTILTKEEEIPVPAFKVEEVDPTGAGDAFDGGFVVGLIRGWEHEKIGRYANAVGALKVTKFGPMEVPFAHEVEQLFKTQTVMTDDAMNFVS